MKKILDRAAFNDFALEKYFVFQEPATHVGSAPVPGKRKHAVTTTRTDNSWHDFKRMRKSVASTAVAGSPSLSPSLSPLSVKPTNKGVSIGDKQSVQENTSIASGSGDSDIEILNVRHERPVHLPEGTPMPPDIVSLTNAYLEELNSKEKYMAATMLASCKLRQRSAIALKEKAFINF